MACLFLNVYYEQEVIIELIKQVKETKTDQIVYLLLS